MIKLIAIGIALALSATTASAQDVTEAQINEAIALGKAGNVPIVKISKWSADFDIYIAGPVARIAAAARDATKHYKPFTRDDVRSDDVQPFYVIRVTRRLSADPVLIGHIVLQPKGAQGVDGAIQPLKPRTFGRSLYEFRFDHLPEGDGDFQIVVVSGDRPEVFTVSAKDRARIR